MQGSFQAAGLFVSLAMALVGGLIVGELGGGWAGEGGALWLGDPRSCQPGAPGNPLPLRLELWGWGILPAEGKGWIGRAEVTPDQS